MIDLLAAITEAFDGFAYDYYLSLAPKDTALPFAVGTIVSDVPDYQTRNGNGLYPYIETATIQFDIYADTDTAVLSGLDLIAGLFNNTQLDLSDDTYLGGRRTGGIPARVEDDAWRGTAVYEFKVERA